ncbi:MAG: dipeptide epimerase [Planctomycetota bacterium]|nr:dipeptide epimerase [Planctomycetota bacterium]
MEVSLEEMNLELKVPFTIARGTTEVSHNLLCTVRADGIEGYGESAPSSFYGEDQQSVKSVLEEIIEQLPDDLLPVHHIISEFLFEYPQARAAICALDVSLYDLLGKRLNAPLYRIFALDPSHTPLTSFTIGISAPDDMVKYAKEAAKTYPILKIKLGTKKILGEDYDIEVIERIRKETEVTLRVDANCAWQLDEAAEKIPILLGYDVEFFEQPFPPENLDDFRFLKERCPDALIFADESCVVPKDIPDIAPFVDGINIKLAKCGGITEAIRMIHTARSHNLLVMLGCMVESSCLITAAAQISPLADYADLDGNLLCRNDPFKGVTVEDGKLILPERPGLGILRVTR